MLNISWLVSIVPSVPKLVYHWADAEDQNRLRHRSRPCRLQDKVYIVCAVMSLMLVRKWVWYVLTAHLLLDLWNGIFYSFIREYCTIPEQWSLGSYALIPLESQHCMDSASVETDFCEALGKPAAAPVMVAVKTAVGNFEGPFFVLSIRLCRLVSFQGDWLFWYAPWIRIFLKSLLWWAFSLDLLLWCLARLALELNTGRTMLCARPSFCLLTTFLSFWYSTAWRWAVNWRAVLRRSSSTILHLSSILFLMKVSFMGVGDEEAECECADRFRLWVPPSFSLMQDDIAVFFSKRSCTGSELCNFLNDDASKAMRPSPISHGKRRPIVANLAIGFHWQYWSNRLKNERVDELKLLVYAFCLRQIYITWSQNLFYFFREVMLG